MIERSRSLVARVCVIRQGYYPLDTRVRREVHALASAGHEVDVICVRRPGQPRRERSGGVTVYRLPLPLQRGDGRGRYVLQYAMFGLAAAVLCAALHLRRRWDVVQVNSMPDVLVFAAVVPRLFGARVLLDLHECMPEFFAVKYGVGPRHPAVRLVAAAEQASIRFADRVLTCTEPMRQAFVARGAPASKIDVVLNAADEAVFDVRRHPPATRRPDAFTLICHGAIERSYGHDTLLRAAALQGRDPRAADRDLRRRDVPAAARPPGGRTRARRRRADQRGLGAARPAAGARSRPPMPASSPCAATRSATSPTATRCSTSSRCAGRRSSRGRAPSRRTSATTASRCSSLATRTISRGRSAHCTPTGLGERLVARAADASAPYRWSHQRPHLPARVEELPMRKPRGASLSACAVAARGAGQRLPPRAARGGRPGGPAPRSGRRGGCASP